jgi:hypothetical protein
MVVAIESGGTTEPTKSSEDTQLPPEASSNLSVPLSKNAQKKAAKVARFAAQKLERRAKEKEAKKEKKRIKAQKRAAGELEEDEVQEEEEKKRMMKRAKTGSGQKLFGARVCVDLGFDDMMTDKVGENDEVLWIERKTYFVVGNHIIVLAARVRLQCEPKIDMSIFFCLVHISQWPDIYATRANEQCSLQEVDRDGVVAGGV